MLGILNESVVVEVIYYVAMPASGHAVGADGEPVFSSVAVGTGEVKGKGVAHVVGTHDESAQSETERTVVVGWKGVCLFAHSIGDEYLCAFIGSLGTNGYEGTLTQCAASSA